MSEPQNEYETESDTDAEPTPGPARVSDETHVRAHPEKAGMDTEIIMGPSHYGNDLPQEEQRANAELTSAAFTAAQEAREMGYDPQEAVEVLPKLLRAAEKMKDYGHLSKCDKILMNGDYPCSCGWQEYVDALDDALASAEGS